jgi:predicted site-specific integrase-resolvase
MQDFDSLEAALLPMNTTRDLADRAGIAPSTLSTWRATGVGPRFVKIGRKVLYPKEEVLRCMRENLHSNTGEYQEAR